MSRITSSDVGLLVLRLGYTSLLFGLHGWPRLIRIYNHFVLGMPWGFVGVVEGLGLPYPLFFALASSFAEAICSLLIGLGVATRLAAFVVACNMAVAFYSEASKGSWAAAPPNPSPIDLPGMYLLVAVSLMILGGGSLTIQRLFGRK